jgi:NAD(P)H dehydrogenase (quinone)
MICITTGGTPQRFSEGDAYGPIGQILKPIEHLSLRYMGMKIHAPFVALAAPRVDEAARISYPAAWREHLQAVLDAA